MMMMFLLYRLWLSDFLFFMPQHISVCLLFLSNGVKEVTVTFT